MVNAIGDEKMTAKKQEISLDLLLIQTISSVWRGTYKKTLPCYEITVKLIHDADDELVLALKKISGSGKLEWPAPSTFRIAFDYASVNTPERIDRAVRTAVKKFYQRTKQP